VSCGERIATFPFPFRVSRVIIADSDSLIKQSSAEIRGHRSSGQPSDDRAAFGAQAQRAANFAGGGAKDVDAPNGLCALSLPLRRAHAEGVAQIHHHGAHCPPLRFFRCNAGGANSDASGFNVQNHLVALCAEAQRAGGITKPCSVTT